MKQILLVIMVIPSWLLGQWNNDFSQNQLNDWSGDTAHYRVNNNGQLQLFGPSQNNTSTIYRQSQAILNGKWEMDIQMNFNPSSSNYCQIHLSLDQNEDGYFVRLGGTDDEVSLYKTSNNQTTKIIDGINDFLDLDSTNVSIRVERDSLGNWQLWAKNQEWILQGSAFDKSFNMSERFAVSCIYTSTRSERFFFDNIVVNGTSFVDTFATPLPNDIVINEILFNPVDGDNDFVEIYNRSSKTLNIKDLMLGNYFGGRPDNFKDISNGFYLMKPAEIIVLSSSLSDLLFYHPQAMEERVFELESMPGYNNQEGTVVLAIDSTIIDVFSYHEDLHFPYLNSVDGVSLERIDTEIQSNRNDNWHSASEGADFSSPTLENSQKTQPNNGEDKMKLSPKIISPDNDGIDDVLQIDIEVTEQGYNASILIFDSKGRLINQLVNNAFLGTKNTFYWDGLNQNRQAVQTGRYIVLFQAISPSGPTIAQKKTIVVSY
ncbi:lamin tail domain-containing protein [Flavobacteriales bacterium]|nr:lamin tail domain-containing protein [Flavobacteriales bacterium]